MSETVAKTSLSISLGLMEKPLVEQLKGLLPKEEAELFDKMSNAISMLYIYRVIPDAECDKARKRLMKMIQTRINKERKQK